MKFRVMSWEDARELAEAIGDKRLSGNRLYGISDEVWKRDLDHKEVGKDVMRRANYEDLNSVTVCLLSVPVAYIEAVKEKSEDKPSEPKFKFNVGDRVRILDGSKIEGYTAGWIKEMKPFVGRTAEIRRRTVFDGKPAYKIRELGVTGLDVCYSFDERGLKKAIRRPIVISADGNTVTAVDKETGEKGIAKCSPDDKYDFRVGALIAVNRLLTK